MEKPSYYAIIPANVRYDKRLTDKAKLLYGEITCLTNKTGECWASNPYFADLYGVSKQTISNTISLLIKYGYITSELIYKDGGKEVEKRVLKIPVYPIINDDLIPYIRNLIYLYKKSYRRIIQV